MGWSKPFFLLPLLMLAGLGGALAEEGGPAPAPPDACHGQDAVIAKVNGAAIHCRELMEEYAGLPDEAHQQPFDKVLPILRRIMVTKLLLEPLARADGFPDRPEVKQRVADAVAAAQAEHRTPALAEREALVEAYADHMAQEAVSDAKLHELYDQYIAYAAKTDGDEVCARHILVEDEDSAKAIIVELKKGGDFAAIAREKTRDPSGKESGGDLGCFSKDQMVPEFSAAAFALKNKGDITETPVKTAFGWHVIELEDRHAKKPPTFEELKASIVEQAGHQVFLEKVQGLVKAAKIEQYNLDGSPLAEEPKKGD